MDNGERTVGQFPLSIATSLAIESMFGIHPDIKVSKPPINDFDHFWVNLRTLFRNFDGALPKESTRIAANIAEGMMEEMDMIKTLVQERTNNRVKVIFYVSNYNSMEGKYKHAVIRRDSTPLQKETSTRCTTALTLILKQHKDTKDISVFDRKLQGVNLPRALILTHIPYDLTSSMNFSELVLLESHTGKIKNKSQWYTKYLDGNSLAIIPFREDLLQIFGDKETFRPMNIEFRRALIAVAEKYQWSSVTTTDKIRYGINTVVNPYAKKILLDIIVN